MKKPGTCIQCPYEQCAKSNIEELGICDYGVAYYNNGEILIRKEEKTTLRNISQNLRHELNKILQLIVMEALKIDKTISTKSINLDSPASRIVGATIIIDQFIEMISGINDFHPSKKYSDNMSSSVGLKPIIEKYSKIYSLVNNTRRCKNIEINILCDIDTKLRKGASIIEYIIATLIDNIWKYSIDNNECKIHVVNTTYNTLDISFVNFSKKIEHPNQIFEKGHQEDGRSEGFGYGLYWVSILISHYNDLYFNEGDLLEIVHTQTKTHINENIYKQKFLLRNIKYEN